MSESHEGTAFVLGVVMTMLLFLWVLMPMDEHASHAALGSKGHACFANHTCRENLKCLVADGIDATCVKP